MRVTFGTWAIIAIVIFFNWSSIKEYFNEKFSNSSGPPVIENKSNVLEESKKNPPKAPEKADPFKEFK